VGWLVVSSIIVATAFACTKPPPEPLAEPACPESTYESPSPESLLPQGDRCKELYDDDNGGVASHPFEPEKLTWVVIDRSELDDLQRVYLSARREDSQPVLVGRITQRAFRRIGGRLLFEQLLGNRVIVTYSHLEAKFCLVSEKVSKNAYEAVFSGYHEYWTCERHYGPVNFSFEVTADGEMLVRKLRR
jgi:hypothetical protein